MRFFRTMLMLMAPDEGPGGGGGEPANVSEAISAAHTEGAGETVDDASASHEGGEPELAGDAAPPDSGSPTPTPTPNADDADAGESEGESEGADESEGTDWETWITERGGEENLQRAVDVYDALATEEGVKALFKEAGQALGLGADRLAELMGEGAPAAPGEGNEEESIEDLLADPDRVLTASEVARILEAQQNESRAEQTKVQHVTMVRDTVESTLAELEVDDADVQAVVLQFADAALEGKQETRENIAEAIQSGWQRFQALVDAKTKQTVSETHERNKKLPKPLPSGGQPGGETLPEPANIKEAIARQAQRARQSA